MIVLYGFAVSSIVVYVCTQVIVVCNSNKVLIIKLTGKWPFLDVFVGVEHGLVERQSSCQPGFSFCCWNFMHLLNRRVHLHQQVLLLNVILIFTDLFCFRLIKFYGTSSRFRIRRLLYTKYLNLTFSYSLSCRVKATKSIKTQSRQSLKLVVGIAGLYCIWCAFKKYWRNPPQPAVGEEADLGVLVFLSVYFFLPHSLCIISMNSKDVNNAMHELPL